MRPREERRLMDGVRDDEEKEKKSFEQRRTFMDFGVDRAQQHALLGGGWKDRWASSRNE